MKRDVYAYITTTLLVMAFGFSVFLIVSDNLAPFTTQATVKANVVDVVPEVSGYIMAMNVHEGETVSSGQTLFDIEPEQYQLELKQSQSNFDLTQSQWQLAYQNLTRTERLFKQRLVSQEEYDQAITNEHSRKADLNAAQAKLELAKLNLKRTHVLSHASGTVTNLVFKTGMYANSTQNVVHIVQHQQPWIEADFTEKGLTALKNATKVDIVYDAIPNRVFQGNIVSVDRAIQSGMDNNDSLSSIVDETRWIRPQQKVRVRIISNDIPPYIIAGSRASVMLHDKYEVSSVWMTLLSWMRFVY